MWYKEETEFQKCMGTTANSYTGARIIVQRQLIVLHEMQKENKYNSIT